ncbi:leucine-rich repeat protein, partial [Acinetobacter haemolyticus]|uniref:leucine-rich repeat protein n=1 Tax=Acinetobacter haemolyticus TaxID=29430 RepID=UPI000D68DB60
MIKLPLVGPAYKMQAQSISCQNCINWYPQTIEYPNGSRVAALMPTPGLKKIFQGISSAVRCLHVLSNGALLVVIGNKLYHSKANKFDLIEVGLISALGTVRAADNGRVALIVNGTYTYSLDLKNLTLTRLSGSAIPRSTHVVFLDGRFVFNKANTGQFHWSDLYSTNVNALSYATAESTPDNVTAIIEFNSSELWLFGSQSVERYYGAGSANAPYARLSGGAMSFGCLAPDSIVALATGVIWLGVSEFGGSQIVMSAGGVPERISTHALEEEIASFSKTSDATAYAYQMEGHVFYVISFPSANVTFCYDASTGLWHQRSFANPQGLHERHRSQHHAFYNNTHIVGDYRNGKLYQLDNNIFTDDGELIMRERTAQAVITDGKLTRFNNLEIVCEVGFEDRKPKPTPQPPVISCVGALNITDWIDIDGDWQLEIEGNPITSIDTPIETIIDLLRSNNFEVDVEVPIEDWDIEYVLNGETIREITGNPIPDSYAENQGEGRTSLIINNTITHIGGDAFADWTSCTSLTIPNSVTHIGGDAFADWTSCTSLTIPNSVTHIGGDAFADWTSCTSLT